MKLQRAVLIGVLLCTGCGGGSPSSGPTPTSVTSVTITPPTAQVVSGQTKQFSATVAGSGGVSQAVTWSVAGDGTISSSGLFTAGGVTGTATVMVASVQDPTVINSASVSVGAISISAGNWAGAITTADGTQKMPLDFEMDRTVAASGTALSFGAYGPLTIFDNRNTQIPPCSNITLQQKPSTNNVSGDMNKPGGISLSGMENGTGLNPGDVKLAWQTGATAATVETLSLSGQFSPDGSTLSGSYTNTGFLAGCFPSNTSGTFAFSLYNLSSGTYSGTFTYGTLGAIPITMTSQSVTIGSIPGICGSATTVGMLLPTEDGRFFHTHSDNFTKSSLEVWGIMNDIAGKTITIYTALEGGTQDSPCVANPVSLGLISGITLTKN